MPAKRTAKKASAGAAPSAETPSAETSTESADVTADATTEPADPTETTEPTAAAEEPEVEHVPLNRAERRARGKGGAAPQPTSRGKVVGGKGPASTQRMWANRRSG
jgi:hypothetical protein